MEGIMEVIRTIRNLRAEMNVAASRRTRLMLLPGEGWQQALAEGDYRLTVEAGGLDDDPVSYSTGSYEGEALSLRSMPEAMALAFTHNGQTYTCTAYPTEVYP